MLKASDSWAFRHALKQAVWFGLTMAIAAGRNPRSLIVVQGDSQTASSNQIIQPDRQCTRPRQQQPPHRAIQHDGTDQLPRITAFRDIFSPLTLPCEGVNCEVSPAP